MNAIRALFMAAFLTTFAACGGGGAPVQSPTTLAAGKTPELTEQVILDVLPKRGWTPENVQPGRVVAFHSKGPHLLRIELRYDARQIGIYYVDSDNLNAQVGSDGQVYAHKRVNGWIRNLAVDLASGLAANGGTTTASGGMAPVPSAAPPAVGAGAAPPASPPAAPPATGAPPPPQ